jgi:hypothetical protein
MLTTIEFTKLLFRFSFFLPIMRSIEFHSYKSATRQLRWGQEQEKFNSSNVAGNITHTSYFITHTSYLLFLYIYRTHFSLLISTFFEFIKTVKPFIRARYGGGGLCGKHYRFRGVQKNCTDGGRAAFFRMGAYLLDTWWHHQFVWCTQQCRSGGAFSRYRRGIYLLSKDLQ